MQMEPLAGGCLKILLSSEDLARYALSFDTLDYKNEPTRRALSALLREAQTVCDFPLNEPLLIEALPIEDGCLLLITPDRSGRRVRLKRSSGPYIYEVESTDRLLQLAGGLARLSREQNHRFVGSSSLYRYGNTYHLVLYPLHPLPARLRRLLDALTTPRGQGDSAAAFSAEHGTAVSVGDALERLTAAG